MSVFFFRDGANTNARTFFELIVEACAFRIGLAHAPRNHGANQLEGALERDATCVGTEHTQKLFLCFSREFLVERLHTKLFEFVAAEKNGTRKILIREDLK